MGAGCVETKICLFGGYGGAYLDTINIFDTENNTITTSNIKLPTACYSMGVGSVGTKIYLFGGYGGSAGYLSTTHCYTPEGIFADEENTTKTIITYNGNQIASLDEGQSAIFPKGKKATDDVIITFSAKGSITYKGMITEVEKGKMARLLFKGKKFGSDIVVSTKAEKKEYNLSFEAETGTIVSNTAPETIAEGETVMFTVQLSRAFIGYKWSFSYTPTATVTYTSDDPSKPTYTFTISNPTDDVIITITTVEDNGNDAPKPEPIL